MLLENKSEKVTIDPIVAQYFETLVQKMKERESELF